MATTLERIPSEGSSFWSFKGKDPSIDAYFLMGSPVPVLLILTTYFLIVILGPRFMKNRPAFSLNKTLFYYNAIQILITGSLVIGILTNDELFRYGLLYAGCPYSKHTIDPKLVLGTWIYFLGKITELMDTVFFVLRKKNNQITFLHVFHHATMVLYMWSYLKYAAAGDGAILALFNGLTHIVMYSYYLLAGLGPKFQKYLWWKKYVTEIQLLQFILMLIYLVWTYFSPKCEFSTTFTAIIITNVSIFLILFLNFYIKSYKNKSSQLKAKSIANVCFLASGDGKTSTDKDD